MDILNQRLGFFKNNNYPKGDGPLCLAFARTYPYGKTRTA
jgi:hypothetical protein